MNHFYNLLLEFYLHFSHVPTFSIRLPVSSFRNLDWENACVFIAVGFKLLRANRQRQAGNEESISWQSEVGVHRFQLQFHLEQISN